ncbi:MAG: helix-hairpin-helix domain-containing protein [Chloroflexi bacterium]|nr:helix-hairpin-helix domain-containing protein [Chloroflexota bacterium]
MFRFSIVRHKVLAAGLLLVLLTAACGSGVATSQTGASQAGLVVTPVLSGNTAGQTTLVKVNLNTASGDDFLAAVPGLGNRMVREFMEYRPYVSIQQFRREIGKYVDAAQVAEYEKYVFVPVSVNEADAETLKQLPGVGDALAVDLIASRPYASNDGFLAKLTGQVSDTELVIAKTYLATP